MLQGYEINKDTLLALKKLSNATAEDASAGASKNKTGPVASPAVPGGAEGVLASSCSDGLLEVEEASQLRFTEDDRVHEVCCVVICMLKSYMQRTVVIFFVRNNN